MNLPPRQAELLTLVGRGLMNKQIAYEMGISEGTVKITLRNLKLKLGCRTRVELALRAHGIEV